MNGISKEFKDKKKEERVRLFVNKLRSYKVKDVVSLKFNEFLDNIYERNISLSGLEVYVREQWFAVFLNKEPIFLSYVGRYRRGKEFTLIFEGIDKKFFYYEGDKLIDDFAYTVSFLTKELEFHNLHDIVKDLFKIKEMVEANREIILNLNNRLSKVEETIEEKVLDLLDKLTKDLALVKKEVDDIKRYFKNNNLSVNEGIE